LSGVGVVGKHRFSTFLVKKNGIVCLKAAQRWKTLNSAAGRVMAAATAVIPDFFGQRKAFLI
jgi:hypothetical protein